MSQKTAAEEAFDAAWKQDGLEGADIVHDYRFHPKRKWKFDFAFPSEKVAVEVQGRSFGRGAGGHHTFVGANRDSEKYNAAVEHGWRVLTYQTSQLRNPKECATAVEQVCRVLCRICDC